jgi:hypothetical protein
MRKPEPWSCPRCGLEGDHLKSPDPTRCKHCCRADAADDLYAALSWAMGNIGRPHRIRGQNDHHCDRYEQAVGALRRAEGGP